MTLRPAAAVIAILALGAGAARGADLFVDATTGDDANDGLAWASARLTLTSALATAALTPEPDVISVAEGAYREHVTVPADTWLFGGFATGGGERDPAVHRSVIGEWGWYEPGSPLVNFPPGSNGTLLEGFVVRGNKVSSRLLGGGIRVEDAAPVIRGNVIEGNSACGGGGIAVLQFQPGPSARVDNNLIRWNDDQGPAFSVCDYFYDEGGGLLVYSGPGVDLGIVAMGNLFVENSLDAIGVYLNGSAEVRDNILLRNRVGIGQFGQDGRLRVVNSVVTGSSGVAVLGTCNNQVLFENVTLAGNAGALTIFFPTCAFSATLTDSIVWGNQGPPLSTLATQIVADHSIIEGGFPGGTDVWDVDPLFVPGPLGDVYLSQPGGGQMATSLAVDAGSRLASDAGLDQRTTAITSLPDSGLVDLGYHFLPWVGPVAILRGETADNLVPHAAATDLPWSDAAGSLSDPALPLLFYRVEGMDNEIGVRKHLPTDALRLIYQPGW